LNREGIRKPAYFAYKYLHALQGESVATSDPQAMLAVKDGNVSAVIWEFEQPEQKVSNRPFYTKLVPAHATAPVRLVVRHLTPGWKFGGRDTGRTTHYRSTSIWAGRRI
jgi:xylan 1,4-beta-xylosidase